MSGNFLSNFMRVALEKTGAERALAADAHLAIVDMLNFEQADVLDEDFIGLDIMRQALESGEPIISNNAVQRVIDAPNTNTSFTNLRLIVVIPVAPVGVVYLDQHIRRGIIPKEIIERLAAFGSQAVQNNQMDRGEDELHALYDQLV